MDHETARELTAAHALHALDARDERALEEHLATCSECRAELDAFRGSAAALATLPAEEAPPPELRERLLERAGAERSNVVPLRPRRSRAVLVSGALAAAAVVAAVALGLYALSLSRSLDDERAATDVLADPAARALPLQGAPGRLVVASDGRAALVTGLAGAPEGRTYELWIIRGEDTPPEPAGLFSGEAERDVVQLDGRVPRGGVVAVTVEPEGGVDAPTSQPIVTAQA